jgi:hypothetical protein
MQMPLHLPHPASVAAATAARLEARREELRCEGEALERQVEGMCKRVAPYLRLVDRREVQKWAVVKNTDLRASRWLLHVCSSTRKRSGLRY